MPRNNEPGHIPTDETLFHEYWQMEEDERDEEADFEETDPLAWEPPDEGHPCPTCDGEGMVDFGQCPDCGGDGTHLAYQ